MIAKIHPAGATSGNHQTTVPPPPPLNCPRCDSSNTKFCYYNNYSLSQPRHFCKSCKRYWTRGGTLRNVPIGGGCRKNKRPKKHPRSSPATADPSLPPPPIIPADFNPLFYNLPKFDLEPHLAGFDHGKYFPPFIGGNLLDLQKLMTSDEFSVDIETHEIIKEDNYPAVSVVTPFTGSGSGVADSSYMYWNQAESGSSYMAPLF